MDPEQEESRTGNRLLSALERFALAGTRPEDKEDDRIRKATLTVSSVIVILLSPIWIVTYFALGFLVPASIPLVYEVVSIASLVIFLRTKRYRAFRFTQILLMALLPFLLQISLGGFVAASGVILWSFTSPVGALLFYGRERALWWFAVFAGLVVSTGILEPFIDPVGRIPAPIHFGFFVMNVLGPCLTTFLLVHYFVRQRDVARAALDEQHRLLLIERERSE
ncbi:MAG TPA: hypothetical protein VFK89_06720, partial [Actinomycetota bacterium]|nr:hypothetical protein [Actinomycetota bacterium]